MLSEVTELFQRQGHNLSELPIVNVYAARDRARRGDRGGAIAELRAVVEQLVPEGQLLTWGIPATAVLVETLLGRGAEGDAAEAAAAIAGVAQEGHDQDLPVRDIWLLRMRAMLARSTGDAGEYARLAGQYLEMASSLGFERHIGWAEGIA